MQRKTEMKDKGMLTEAVAEWEAPVILISKKRPDGTPKNLFRADFRGLNSVTEVPVYATPLLKRISKTDWK
jgi:hypothetical protein